MPITNKSDAFPDRAHDRSIKKIARNTWRYTSEDGSNVIRLHHTDIVKELPDGKFWLNTSGWRSVTTKDRMNNALKGYSVYSDKGIWYVRKANSWNDPNAVAIPYYDGMILPDAFNGAELGKAKAASAEDKALIKSINAYCKTVRDLPELPQPSNGDCWHCLMFDREDSNEGRGKGWGKAREEGQTGPAKNPDHLREHIREGYIHGSLIVNALRWSGMTDNGIAMALNGYVGRDLVVQRLRRYLKRKLGVG